MATLALNQGAKSRFFWLICGAFWGAMVNDFYTYGFGQFLGPLYFPGGLRQSQRVQVLAHGGFALRGVGHM